MNDDLRIGDAEREAAVAALGEHYVAGRITREELDERSDRVARARTHRDLRPLFADLPSPGRRPGASLSGSSLPTRPSARRSGPLWWRAVPVLAVPVLVLLLVLTVLTHLPLILLGLVAFLVLRGWSRRYWRRHQPIR